MRWVPVLAACALLLGSLAGCSLFMHSIEKPKASVRDVSISAAGLGGVSGQLQLDVTNPNGFGVPLAGVDWELSIGGARAVTGTVQLSQTIPARGVAPVATSLTVAASDALAVAAALSGGARGYTVRARLHFSTPVGQLDVDVEHAGTLGGGGGLGAAARGVLGLR
ncbi:MAG TPA: LEA type 2 family protein [Kofleriaceae bacterium]|nr:LEA type 2 family protein [Kofleriaceae bacterium]